MHSIDLFRISDYRPMPALDRYDPENLDDNVDYEELSVDGRREAEREMRRRDREEGLLHRDDRDLLYGI